MAESEQIDGAWVARDWDQRWALPGGIDYRRGQRTYAAALNAHQGWPTTRLTTDAEGVLQVGPRNQDRHDTFLSLDLRASREIAVSRGSLRVYAELTNALDRNNPCCSEYRLDAAGALTLKTETWLPLVPSIGLVWQLP